MHRITICAALLVIAAALPAQQLAPMPAATTTVSAPRILDVIVSDSHGKRISGLTAADFQVLQNGKPQEITKFADLSLAAGAPDTNPPRRILVAFDMSSLSIQGRRKSVDAVRALLKRRARPNDRVMIAQLSSVGATTPVAGWTSDAAEIERQLGVIEGLSVADRSFERKQTEQNIQAAVEFDKQQSSSMITFDSLMSSGRQYAASAQAEARRTIAAIDQVVGMMGQGSGKKVLILAGGGLQTRPGSEIFEYLDGIKSAAEMGQTGPGVASDARRSNPRSEISHYTVAKEVGQLAEDARNRGVVVYAVQPDTAGSTQMAVERKDVADTSADFTAVADQMSGYAVLTSQTGGLALMGATPESASASIASDFDTHYALTFVETLAASGTDLPKIEVKVLKPGTRVRASFAGGPVNKDSEMKEAVVANQLGTPASNDLGIDVKKDEPVPDGANRKVGVTVMIPIKSLKLTPAGDDVTGAFTVYICTGDAQGHTSEVNRQTKELRFPASAVPQLMEKSIGFRVDVMLIPGRTQISVGVLDPNSEQTGYAKVSI